MGKHVCPVCEDIYAIRASVTLDGGVAADTVESWGCPSCSYQFVSYEDVVRLVAAALGPEANPVSLRTHFLADRKIVFRDRVLDSSST